MHNHTIKTVICLVLSLGIIAGTTHALTPEKEAEARQIFKQLIAPCCWTTSVADHGSGAAPKIQAEIRTLLEEGRTRDEIIAHYVDIYGERILVEPPRRGFNLLAYWMPWVVLVAGIGAIILFARRARAPSAPQPSASAQGDASLDPYRKRVREEVRRLDA